MNNNEDKNPMEGIKWEFSRISKALTFRLGDEPEIVHFIRTGFTTGEATYHVIQEDAYSTKPDGKDFLMYSSEIKKKFDIDIDKEFADRLKLNTKKLSIDDMIAIIDDMIEPMDEENNIYFLDFITLIQALDYSQASKVHDAMVKYAKRKNIMIVTAKQDGQD